MPDLRGTDAFPLLSSITDACRDLHGMMRYGDEDGRIYGLSAVANVKDVFADFDSGYSKHRARYDVWRTTWLERLPDNEQARYIRAVVRTRDLAAEMCQEFVSKNGHFVPLFEKSSLVEALRGLVSVRAQASGRKDEQPSAKVTDHSPRSAPSIDKSLAAMSDDMPMAGSDPRSASTASHLKPVPVKNIMQEDGGGAQRSASVSASSTLPADLGMTFGPENLIDGDLTTSWQPSAKGVRGVGEWFEIRLQSQQAISGLEIANGFQRVWKGSDLFPMNSRLRKIRVLADGRSLEFTFASDVQGFTFVPIDPPIVTSRIRVDVVAIHRGTRWPDLAVSEVRVIAH